MPNGTYECNYTAVYHLTTHDERMLPEDLFQYALVQLYFLALQIKTYASVNWERILVRL